MELNVFRVKDESLSDTKPQTILCLTDNAISVFLPNGKHGFSEGLLDANESLVCLAGNRQYLSLHSILLEEDLHPGACGKWAFDSEGNWCGHIVAGLPGVRIAYVASASQIFSDIRKKTGITPSTSPGPQTLECVRSMKGAIAGLFDRRSGLYASTLYAVSSGGHEKVVQMLLNVRAGDRKSVV